eukprot:scaffold7483_cov286-Pinguiococcus_pyrenoidosus.AAC.2
MSFPSPELFMCTIGQSQGIKRPQWALPEAHRSGGPRAAAAVLLGHNGAAFPWTAYCRRLRDCTERNGMCKSQ